jgi:hypothetical protein
MSKLDCEIGFKVDWLRATFDYNVPKSFLLDSHPAFAMAERSVGAMPSYNRSLVMKCGRFDWHSERRDQKLMLTMTGEDCTRFRAMGGDFRKLIRFLNEQNDCHFTRIDLAVDLLGGKRKPPTDVYNAVVSGKAKCRAQRHHKIVQHNSAGENIGETAYIGSRTSETMLRIYDKAAQTGLNDQPWTRVEIELKNRQADAAAWAIERGNVEMTAREMIGAFCSETGVQWYEALLSDKTAPKIVEEPGRKETNFERWIQEICLPAIERALREDLPGVRDQLRTILNKPVE